METSFQAVFGSISDYFGLQFAPVLVVVVTRSK